jgi:hypothetical protein
MIKKLSVLLASIALALDLTAVPATAAASDCPDLRFCIWTGDNFTGSRYEYSRSNFTDTGSPTHPLYNGIRLPSGLTNQGSSFYNRLGQYWDVNIYDAVNCDAGQWFRTVVNGQAANAAGSDWQNRVSSIQLQSASPLHC